MIQQILEFALRHEAWAGASAAGLVVSHIVCFMADHCAVLSGIGRIFHRLGNLFDVSGRLAQDIRDRKMEDALTLIRNLSQELMSTQQDLGNLRQVVLDPTAKSTEVAQP